MEVSATRGQGLKMSMSDLSFPLSIVKVVKGSDLIIEVFAIIPYV
jgi:hypothetical protein